MGWDDQWLANFAGCLEQSDVGSGAQVFCGRHYFLRDGDFRRTFVIDQKRECFVALYGLDDRARPFRCIGLERIHDIWNGVLAVASIVSDQTLEQIDGGLAFLDRNHWNPPLHCPDLRCWYYPRIDVARDGRTRSFAVSRLYRHGAIDCSILVGENFGRGALHYWNRHALLECDHDLAQPSQSLRGTRLFRSQAFPKLPRCGDPTEQAGRNACFRCRCDTIAIFGHGLAPTLGTSSDSFYVANNAGSDHRKLVRDHSDVPDSKQYPNDSKCQAVHAA